MDDFALATLPTEADEAGRTATYKVLRATGQPRVSVGVFLCLAAFALPGYVLRDNAVLRVSEKELAGLNATSRDELERRQRLASDIGEAALPIAVVLLMMGLGVLLWSVPDLKLQEQTDTDRAKAELQDLQSRLRRQTEEELETEARREAAEVDAAQSGVRNEKAPAPESTNARRERVDRLLDIEREVLSAVAALVPMPYAMQTRVALPGRMSRSPWNFSAAVR
ncbi:hypothetical protein GKE82_04795 [Conexibacter sp. W3-3-2]|uniref:hypothetical protein n=1 Tax=Conexibacter sp. W3-3-2 TaxID=2675227 RepID=UPI0012B72D04|nr:hypothetical protein [Conexibacter sp. W3-3-2]MTD43639.1 hypothetical protein [Conexibacter sp. W3-3-2]